MLPRPAVWCSGGKSSGRADTEPSSSAANRAPNASWEGLPPGLQKKRIEEITREIEEETKARLEERGIPPPGPDALRRQSPDTIPPRSKEISGSSLPRRQQESPRRPPERLLLLPRRLPPAAADELKAGHRNALFPEGSFPPAMPFVSGESDSAQPP